MSLGCERDVNRGGTDARDTAWKGSNDSFLQVFHCQHRQAVYPDQGLDQRGAFTLGAYLAETATIRAAHPEFDLEAGSHTETGPPGQAI